MPPRVRAGARLGLVLGLLCALACARVARANMVGTPLLPGLCAPEYADQTTGQCTPAGCEKYGIDKSGADWEGCRRESDYAGADASCAIASAFWENYAEGCVTEHVTPLNIYYLYTLGTSSNTSGTPAISTVQCCFWTAPAPAAAAPTTVPFTYKGRVQQWNVPPGVTEVTAYVWGAGGAGGGYRITYDSATRIYGGGGGFVKGTIDVTSISTLEILVGQGGFSSEIGESLSRAYVAGGAAGSIWNVESSSNVLKMRAAGGGGRSEIRANGASILIAGGGGGGGMDSTDGQSAGTAAGGGGGGGLSDLNGQGVTNGGAGGTQSLGGVGASVCASPTYMTGHSKDGDKYKGGSMHNALQLWRCNAQAGGGDGWYGGGAGGSIYGDLYGGGGGSSYMNPDYVDESTFQHAGGISGTLSGSTRQGGTGGRNNSLHVVPPANTGDSCVGETFTTVAICDGHDGYVVLEYTAASAPATAACPTTASATQDATTAAGTWNAELKAHDLAAGDTLVFSNVQTPDPLDVTRGFTAVLLARPGAAGVTGDLLTLKDASASTIVQVGASAGAVAVECPGAGAVVDAGGGATLYDPSAPVIIEHTYNNGADFCTGCTTNQAFYQAHVDYVTAQGGELLTYAEMVAYLDVVGSLEPSGSTSYLAAPIIPTNGASECIDIQYCPSDFPSCHWVQVGFNHQYAGFKTADCSLDASVNGGELYYLIYKKNPPTTPVGLGVYAAVLSDDATKARVYAPAADGSFLHAGVGVGGCTGFAGVGAGGVNIVREVGACTTTQCTWDQANTLAQSNGGRLVKAQEMLNWLTENGRIVDVNMWTPVYNDQIADPYKDWMQVGVDNSLGHYTGRLWTDTGSAGDAISGYTNNNAYITDYFWVDMGTNLAQECSSTCPTISGGYYGGKPVDKLFDNIAIEEDISTWTSTTVLTGWAAPVGTASATFQDKFWAQVDLESEKQIHSIRIYTGYIDSSKTVQTESRLAGFRVYISDTSQTDLANFNPTTATLCYEHPDTTPNGEEIVSCVGQARYVVIQVRAPYSNLREVKIYGPAAGSATGKLAGGYSLTLGGPTTGSAFAGLLGEAFVAPRALSRAELGLAIHGLAAYTGDTDTNLHRFYTFDGDLASYHDRAARRRAAAEHEARAVVDPAVGELVVSNLVEAALSGTTINLARACGADGQQACPSTVLNPINSAYTATIINDGITGGTPPTGQVYYYHAGTTGGETWTLDFGQTSTVSNVLVYLRDDGITTSKIEGYELWIGDDNTAHNAGENAQCYKHDGTSIATTSTTTSLDSACVGTGRYFFFYLAGDAGHAWNEIEVMGYHYVYAPAPARRLYALEVAAAQTLDAPVADAFNWASAWTVAAWLRLASGAANVLTLVDGTPATAAVTAVDSLTAGTWTHVALTHDGSGTAAALHVNGAATGTTVTVSALQTDGGSVQITGAAVDDLRVYTSDLSGDLERAGAPAAWSEPTVTVGTAGEPVAPQTVDTDYRVLSFKHDQTAAAAQAEFTVDFPEDTLCDVLIVGGGGGGGKDTAGGGGAGGYYYSTGHILRGQYSIRVGLYGAGSTDAVKQGHNGKNSRILGPDFHVTAMGGGGGASDGMQHGRDGGSGGGNGWRDYDVTDSNSGSPGNDVDLDTQGNSGGEGAGITGKYFGAGGGGAGGSGTHLNGGPGASNSISGSNTYYAAGGQGGYNSDNTNPAVGWSSSGASSIGGAGAGNSGATSAVYQVAGSAGAAHTGSGGGGGGKGTSINGHAGGSGIVIIRYYAGSPPAGATITPNPFSDCNATDPDAASCAALLPAIPGDTGGWRLVRHIPASTCTTSGGTETCTGYWYTGNDNLAGDDVRAPDSDYAVATASGDVQWTKEFGNFDEYLISPGDQARWIQFAQTELVKVTTTGSASTAQNPPGVILNSHLGTATGTFITWWRGTSTTPEDPGIYYPSNSDEDVFYQEHNPDSGNQVFWTTNRMKALEHGVNVFVREAPAGGGSSTLVIINGLTEYFKLENSLENEIGTATVQVKQNDNSVVESPAFGIHEGKASLQLDNFWIDTTHDFGSTHSVACWVYAKNHWGAQYSNTVIFAMGDSTTGGEIALSGRKIYTTPIPQVSTNYKNDGDVDTTLSWFHIAFVQNGGIWEIFFNGIKLYSNSDFSGDKQNALSGVLKLFRYVNTYAVDTGNLNGYAKFLRVYNRVLTAAEVKAIYDAENT